MAAATVAAGADRTLLISSYTKYISTPSPYPTATISYLSPTYFHSICAVATTLETRLLTISQSSGTASTHITGNQLCLPELGLNEQEAEALIEKHPPLQFIPGDSLQQRIASLQSAGISGFTLNRVITKRPEILTLDEVGELLEFVLDELEGLEASKLERLLVFTDPQSFTGFAKRVRVLAEHGIPTEKLPNVLNKVNIRKVFCERSVSEIEKMIQFLKAYGWPELVIRRPALLNLDLETQLIPRIEYLNGLGGGDTATTAVLIGKLPAILTYTLEHYLSHVEFWNLVGLTDGQLFRVALVYPNIFSVSRERKLQPRIGFLQQCGLDSYEIYKFLIKAPLYVSLSEDNLAKKLCFLAKIGYTHRTKDLAAALGWSTRTSCENMQAVIELFFSYGLSCSEILAMSKKHPQILQYNHDSLRKKMEFLIDGMEREVEELLAFPAFLGYKLDNRIKQRYEAKKDVRGKKMSLNKLLSVSYKKFYSADKTLETDPDCKFETTIAD